MSGFRDVMKEGWHSKGKDGGKESWRGDFKGINQVAGWVGRGKDSSSDTSRSEHVSQPLSSLRDPASFGPPPKRGVANTSAESASARRQTSTSDETAYQPEEQEDEPAPPPLPYRANRTGINTEHLPPPPTRRTEPSINSTSTSASRPIPSLPPRLPARNVTSQSPPPPPYSESDHTIQMNEGSMSRLEQAGVSVPALGIGRRDSDQSATAQTHLNNQVNELQSRFARMGSQSLQNARSPEGNTSTGVNGYNNTQSSTPSRPDSRSNSSYSSSTNNFRQRSSEHIETGKQKLSEFNQKHRITERINSYFEKPPAQTSPPLPPHPNLSREGSNVDMDVLNRRKPPPPPPPAKKPSLQSTPVNRNGGSSPPPPLPLGTKPR